MIVAHLSDLHLGYRSYDRLEGGRNVRERDVEAAFEGALERISHLAPELVVVSGDIFDRPDPPASAMVALARGLEGLRASLPDTPVVMVAGSSDTPLRAGGPGALAAFDTIPGVEATSDEVRTVRLLGGDLHVALVPHRALLCSPFPDLQAESDARWNVLVLRGRVTPATSEALASSRKRSRSLPLDTSGWDYVALGYEHAHRDVAPRVAYSGSLERIGPDPWSEAAEEKGFVAADLESGDVRFHAVAGRAVVELAGIRVRPGEPEHVSRRIGEVVRETPGGIDGKIVRMRIQGLPGGAPPRLDEELLDGLRARALHLSVRVDWPTEPPGTASLTQMVRHLSEDADPTLSAELVRLLGGEGAEVAV